MANSDSTNPQDSNSPTAPQAAGFAPWQALKGKRISYLTLPLLVMATVTEFVILATGWKYQQVVCLPKGMGVTFFGIGPIGATILAVEMLKLPLAIWTASRRGWQKFVMITCGLPLICLLTFQLVKDMAVYEMGIALAPASQYLDEATKEEVKIAQLNAQLAAIEGKKADRDHRLADLDAKKARAKAELDDSLKQNQDARQDAISLTDYQRKELADVDARETAIAKQYDADAAQITRDLAELRTRRETEVARAAKWNAEEARIENAYKAKLTDYNNKLAAYKKDKAAYDNANFLERQLMRQPVDPGAPPQQEENTILKPASLAAMDAQIASKETELSTVNTQRRERLAQVENEAHQLRLEFGSRSTSKREETDRKREALLASQAALATGWASEEKQINQQFETAAQRVDAIRADLDECEKRAEGLYEAREAAIKNTQVHRIATTVEIVRGLIFGQRPVSIKSTAKERGDLYTDQISMVRIWVYPVLAFIVAFLPTLLVEIGFSTIFHPEEKRAQHRLGFLGQHLHTLYIRAGRHKILRAERMATAAAGEIAARDRALAAAKAATEKALADKEAVQLAAQQEVADAIARYEEELKRKEGGHTEHLRRTEEEWVAKLAGMADTLNRTVLEKDALRDLQKTEIERQVQMRQKAWSDRITELTHELDEQRAAAEAERTSMMQSHHKKLMEVSEESKAQVFEARRQATNAELAAVEASAKLTHDLKEALHARDKAESELKQQAEAFATKLAHVKDEAARDLEKATRQEKHRLERQQLEFNKTMRQREEDFERQLKQCQQELALGFDARLVEAQNKMEQEARRREADLEHQLECRALEVDARWKQEVQQREEVAQFKLKQREQQLQAQGEVRISEIQAQAEQELRRRESELERQFEAQSREADARAKQELQQADLGFQAKLKQREQELAIKINARETELQKQWASDLRTREEEWERQAEARVRAVETRLNLEARQKEETAQASARQREQDLVAQMTAQAEARQLAAQAQWEAEAEKKTRAAVEPFKALLARAEKERDEARQLAADGAREVQSLQKKLTEASSFLNSWRTGKDMVPAT